MSYLKNKKSEIYSNLMSSAFYRWSFNSLNPFKTRRCANVIADPWPGYLAAGQGLLEGKILTVKGWLPFEQWASADSFTQKQWHCFSYLRDLKAVGHDEARQTARKIILYWIQNQSQFPSLIWQPEIIARRLDNWCSLYHFYGLSADSTFERKMIHQIDLHHKQLRRIQHLEFNPHETLAVYKALMVSSVMLGRKENILEYLRPLLTSLGDSLVHFRLPRDLLILLKDFIDIRTLLRRLDLKIPKSLTNLIEVIAPMLRQLRHGDGKLAHFGQFSPSSVSLIDMAISMADVRMDQRQQKLPLRRIGYERSFIKSNLLILNTGSITPSYFLESASMPLNFEWSVGKDRLIIQGDVLFYNGFGKQLFYSKETEPSLYKKQQDGQTLFEVTSDGAFFLQRTFFQTNSEIRCEESFKARHEPIAYGVYRLLFHPEFELTLQKNHLYLHRRVLQSKTNNTWQLHLSKGTQYQLIHDGYVSGLLLWRSPDKCVKEDTLQWSLSAV